MAGAKSSGALAGSPSSASSCRLRAAWPRDSCRRLPSALDTKRHRTPRVGIIWILAQAQIPAALRDAFRQGLRESGYVEGQTVAIEERFAAGKVELLPGIAEELVRLKVDVLVAS